MRRQTATAAAQRASNDCPSRSPATPNNPLFLSSRRLKNRAVPSKRFLLFLVGTFVIILTWKGRFDGAVDNSFHAKSGSTALHRGAMPDCTGYDGVLHIAQGDIEGAAGSIFFLFVLNQILYAERFNLKPWVHLNNISRYVYDEQVHSNGTTTFQMLGGTHVSWERQVDSITKRPFRYPGKPVQEGSTGPTQYQVIGNGVWNSYFEPVSDFDPTLLAHSNCASKPLIRMQHGQVIPALHATCPWSVRSWRYGGVPPMLRQEHLSYQDWYQPMRQTAHRITQKYYRLLPPLQQRVQDVAPPSSNCLAVHIRHSDKANRRKRIPLQAFQPYVQAYFSASTGRIQQPQWFLATDSTLVLDEIRQNWPSEVVTHLYTQSNVVRSTNKTAVFKMGQSHHRTNAEVLVDIWAMAHCRFLLHGFSAVSEASHYLNPHLHNQSVNLDDRPHLSASDFGELVQLVLQQPE